MNTIEFLSGISSATQTSFTASVTKTVLLYPFPVNSLNLLFPCSSQIIAKSLQVLLVPFFGQWNPSQSLQEDYLVISFQFPNSLFTDYLNFDAKIGIKLDQLRENPIALALESLQLKLECVNLNQVFRMFGFDGLKIASSNFRLTLDSEELPAEIMKYLQGSIEKYANFIEILEAIRPLLKKSQISIVMPMNEYTLQGVLDY